MRILLTTLILITAQLPAAAQSVAPIDTLFRALGLPDIIEIMREEGIGYGVDIQNDMLEGRGGQVWTRRVADIYTLDRMQMTVRNRLDSELAAEDLAPAIAFFSSDLGKRIVGLEVSGRRALMDDAIEEASKETAVQMLEDKPPRLAMLEEFVDVLDLIETNVVGALNSNYAFYQGLAEGGALPGEMTDADILADVWGQEPDIRVDTTEWLYSYLVLAYQPLDDDELRAYTDFFRTDPGQKVNAAVFAAFDEMFVAISLALGLAASQYLVGEDI